MFVGAGESGERLGGGSYPAGIRKSTRVAGVGWMKENVKGARVGEASGTLPVQVLTGHPGPCLCSIRDLACAGPCWPY